MTDLSHLTTLEDCAAYRSFARRWAEHIERVPWWKALLKGFKRDRVIEVYQDMIHAVEEREKELGGERL